MHTFCQFFVKKVVWKSEKQELVMKAILSWVEEISMSSVVYEMKDDIPERKILQFWKQFLLFVYL